MVMTKNVDIYTMTHTTTISYINTNTCNDTHYQNSMMPPLPPTHIHKPTAFVKVKRRLSRLVCNPYWDESLLLVRLLLRKQGTGRRMAMGVWLPSVLQQHLTIPSTTPMVVALSALGIPLS